MKLYVTILLLAGLMAGCNSNKSGVRSKGKKKSYNYSANKAANSKAVNSSTQQAEKRISEPTVVSEDTLEILNENPYYRDRPRTNFQGASGAGTGGSYASSSYRQDAMNKKKKDRYKNRNFDHLYQDKNTAHLVLKNDTTAVEADTTALEW